MHALTLPPSAPSSSGINLNLVSTNRISCDYDPDTGTANDADIATTMIPKCRYDGDAWNGKNFLCDVPRFYGSAADTSLEKRITKTLTIYDNKIVGNVVNGQGDRNDVVLRAVYEF